MDTGKPDAAADADAPVFSATIRPHRSLGPAGFRVLMVLCTAVAAIASVRAIAFGFWPVAAFFVLDVVGLFVAFQVSYRRARAFEEVVLTPVDLLLRRVTHRGQGREWHLNPLWTRLVRDQHEEFGLQRLSLVSRGQAIAIAAELSPDERADFADQFGHALARVKRGV